MVGEGARDPLAKFHATSDNPCDRARRCQAPQRRVRRRNIGRGIMRFLTLAVSTACGLALLAASAAQAAEPVKIRMSWVAPLANWASIIMEKKDLAQHLGKSYTLETVRYQGTPHMITAIANNELEVASLAYSSLALAIENAGLDLRVIGDEFQDGVPGYYSGEFFVRKDSKIDKVEDMKGKVAGTNGAG